MKPEAYSLMKELEDLHWWYRARRDIVCSLVAKYVPRGAQIVDYGGGSGGTARRLRDLGFDVQVAEVAAEALSACIECGLSVINLAEETLPLKGADCILACDVLEHVEDEVALIKQFKAALRPGGILIATVPAFEFLWSGEDFVSSHWRRHTQRSILRNISEGGFTNLWSSYFNTLLSPIVTANILFTRLFRPHEMYRSNIRRLPGWQNQLLYRLFSLENHLLRSIRLPVGTSIAVVAKCAQ